VSSASGSARPRVVYLDHTAVLSGAELALVRLLPSLHVDAHAVLAADGPLAEPLRATGAEVEVLELAAEGRSVRRSEVTPRLPLAAMRATGAYVVTLARRLRALRPDLVHANSLKAGVYGSIAARLAGVPFVWQVHDRISTDSLPAPAVRLVRAMLATLPAAVIANSQSTRDTLGKLSRPIVRVIGNAIPPPPEPARTGEHGGPLRLGLVGTVTRWKGQDVFLDAFARAFPDGSERAVVIGAPLFGDDAYAASLHGLVERLGIAERVEFRGFRDDVPAELGRLDVLVHASVEPEPFGQVVVEGMAAGLPVVAATPGGPAEIVDDGVTGLLYPMGDRDALARAMRELAHDPALRARLGDAGRAAAARYAPERIAAEVDALYADVLARRRR